MSDDIVSSAGGAPYVATTKPVATAGASGKEITHTVIEKPVAVLVEVPEVTVISMGQQGPAGPDGVDGPPGPAGPQGPTGPQGPAGAGAALSVRVFVPVATSEIVESVDALVYRSCKWIITVTDPFGFRYRAGEVLAFHDGVEAHHTHYAIFGAVINYSVDVVLIGTDMSLRVTNADTVQLTVDAVRVGNLLI